tara:strand:- start:645 stop:851 length:207 start_codon:yes stop_codon:yes gene_type:complete
MNKDVGFYNIIITNGKNSLECQIPSGSGERDYLLSKAIVSHRIKKNIDKWRIKDLNLIKMLGSYIETK